MTDFAASIETHYSEWPTFDSILENLNRKGIDSTKVSPRDLYPYDQSHAGGVEATAQLAKLSGIETHSTVLDVGCGMGGAARYLHAEFSCRVVGIDLTIARLTAAAKLSCLTGCGDSISLIAAKAEVLPLAGASVDAIWCQHVTMNLPDPSEALREFTRVLRPSGRLALHEWFLNPRHPELGKAGSTLPFPLPWAPQPRLNHALTSEEFLGILVARNFKIDAEDVTAAMVDALRRDVRALAVGKRRIPAERIAARQNLLEAASEGLLHCLMITASKKSAPESYR